MGCCWVTFTPNSYYSKVWPILLGPAGLYYLRSWAHLHLALQVTASLCSN